MMVLGAVASLALAATGWSYTGTASYASTVRPNGPRTGASGTNFFNVEGSGNNANASFGVLEFTASSFNIGANVTSVSNLTLALGESNAAFTLPGTLNFYLTTDTTTDIRAGSSPLIYDANSAPEGLGTQLATTYLLGTGSFNTTGNVNTGQIDTYTLTLSATAQSAFVSLLNSGGPLRLVVTPTTASTAATYYGSTNTTNVATYSAPTLSFNAALDQPSLTWKGGAGTWNPAGTSGDTSWSGGAWDSTKTAIFNATGGVVNLGGAITAVGMTFNAGGYTVAGSSANPLTLTGGLVQVTNAADTATISASIAGAAGLSKIGAGTLVLSGQNTYTGTTTISVGSLVVSGDGNLGDASAGVALNGGTLRTGAAFTMGSGRTLSGSGTLDMTGGALTVSGPVNAGALTVANGTATFNGSAISFTSAAVNAGSTLAIPSAYTGSARTTFSGDGTVQLGDNGGYGGGFSTSRGNGTAGPTLVLSTGNSLGSGNLFFNAGAIQASAPVTVSSTLISVGGNVTIGGTSPIEFAGGFQLFGSSNKILTINVATTISSGIAPGSGTNQNTALNKAGTSRLTLNSFTNSYVGGTNITGGTLEVSPNGALGLGDITVTALPSSVVTLQIDNNNDSINDSSNLYLTSSGSTHPMVVLNYTGTETIAGMAVDGRILSLGVHNAMTDPNYLSGLGSLTVTALAPVPEPATWALMGMGLGALALLKKKGRGARRTTPANKAEPEDGVALSPARPPALAVAGRRAFTLLELLIVISIIAVLAGLMLSLTSSMKRKSNQVVSINNLRQWGGALVASLSDNNNMMPWEGQAINVSDATAWYNVLPPYINEKPYSQRRVSELPRAGQKSVWVNPAVPTSVNDKYKPYLFCYAMNYYLSTGADRTMRMTKVDKPSATVFFAETGDDFANCNPKYIQAYFGAGDVLKDPNNSANFLFCDGHVQSFRRKEFDPNFGSNSINEANPDTNLTFVPYPGAVQQ